MLARDAAAQRQARVQQILVHLLRALELAGNVSEWCLDRWDEGFYAASPPVDPVCDRADVTARVWRGSNFGDLFEGGSWFRYFREAGRSSNVLGFRCGAMVASLLERR